MKGEIATTDKEFSPEEMHAFLDRPDDLRLL